MGRAERHGVEFVGHWTLSLYAAFNTKTGRVLGKTAPRARDSTVSIGWITMAGDDGPVRFSVCEADAVITCDR